LDTFTGPMRPANWICRTDDLDSAIAAAPVAPGPAVPLTRGDLHWQITVPADGHLPLDGAMPTLIQWAKNAQHPTEKLAESGCRLIQWQVSHPQAALLQDGLALHDPRVTFTTGAAGFTATLDTPNGRVTL
ncbi:MAG: VOC family protein, partial [Alphaproteobacteria bacterium]|nr:VOC family protein [Alphaproteobacteria bacterium]